MEAQADVGGHLVMQIWGTIITHIATLLWEPTPCGGRKTRKTAWKKLLPQKEIVQSITSITEY